ncbi:hypothetical protein CDN99_22410 [Roseateles aquatilis]|uniref:Uncharacterized protein n=1 Tax=Roseateles aquatilis TaxID=431061 RepID=A0A2D0AM41_9BURK|nr:hypothetical protein [Roseateles aquatilis]OWQ85295.1 hypothetical protein CDN99_22410 [Roseateles aquatilis]
MTLFNTLLLREWLQYKWAWIGLIAGPILVLMVLVPFSQVDGLDAVSPEPVALVAGLMTLGLVLALTLAVSGYQLMGLARRDQQDRSIEFWASLPGSHGASVAAPLVAHGLLMPLAAMAIAVVGGGLVGVAMAVKEIGFVALHQMQWPALFQFGLWLAIRLAVGMVLAALWLAPIALALMAASAWLKRWGAPLLIIAVAAFLKLYKGEYAAEVVARVIGHQMEGVGRSLVFGVHNMIIETGEEGHLRMEAFFQMLYQFPQGARVDLAGALQYALQPQFFIGLAVAAGCFWLLVLQRQRKL